MAKQLQSARKADLKYRKNNVTQLNVALYPKDQDIVDYLEGMPNKAEYIRQLIRQDMMKGERNEDQTL